MFNNQNKNFNSIKEEIVGADASTLPIRTMEKDLKDIKNSNFSKNEFIPNEESAAKREVFQSSLSEKQKTSPFMNSSPASTPVEIRNNPSRIVPPIEKDIVIEAEKESESSSGFGKIFGYIALFAILLAGAGGAYYFIMIKDSSAPVITPEISTPLPIETAEPEPSVSNITPEEAIPNNVQGKFNLDKPNFLIIEPPTADKAAIQAIIKKTLYEVSTEKIYTPIEFVLTDNNFAPLSFQDFSKNFGLAFSSGLNDSLKGTFSLFVSNTANGEAGIALFIDIKEGVSLNPILLKEEALLVKEATSLFLGTPIQTKGTPFLANRYKNTEIRYFNIQPSGSMAIDYAILNNKLMIATSKTATLNIIDKISSK